MPRRDPWSYIGLVAFFALLFVALFGDRIAPHEAIYFVPEHGRDPRPYDPGLVFPLGSDILGRDLLSVVLIGARASIAIVLLAALARIGLALAIAASAALWRTPRLFSDGLSELASAVPATLVVLLVVLVFVRGDASFATFIGALALTGWTGPYRLVRLELDRLARMPFTEAAHATGISRTRILLRHHLPHLAPTLAVSTGQQVIASLVALAELGVLGVFVGSRRSIDLSESLSRLIGGGVNAATIADPPEWGGILANSRSIESLWTTRWVFLVPGVALATTAVLVAAIGVALSRRYARRDILMDIRSRGAASIVVVSIVALLLAGALPERYAEARSWAATSRAAVAAVANAEAAFRDAGLVPVAAQFALERDVSELRQSAPASASLNGATVRESETGPLDVVPLLFSQSGGGRVDAPVVFASWGISPSDYPARPTSIFAPPDLGATIAGWPDDYASVDVRRKIALVLRPMGIRTGSRVIAGPDQASGIANALKRGASAVLYVDPQLPTLPRLQTNARANIYQRLAIDQPMTTIAAPPVVLLSPAAADRLLAPLGLKISAIYDALDSRLLATDSAYAFRSGARELGVAASVEVPVERATAHVRTVVGAVPSMPSDAGRVVVWAVTRPGDPAGRDAVDVAAAVARAVAPRASAFVFVAFDPTVDPNGNAQVVADALRGQHIALIVVIDAARGASLQFTTPMGAYVPALDTYADKAGARHLVTRATVDLNTGSYVWPGIRPFAGEPSVIVSGTGGDGDLRADVAALLGYMAGRMALGAEEAPR